MLWDGTRWIDELVVTPERPARRRRLRDWLATGTMVLVLGGLLIPFAGATAAPLPGRKLLDEWAQRYQVTTIQEASRQIRYRGIWTRAYHPDYLGQDVRFASGRGATASLKFSGTAISWIGPVGPTRGRARVFIDGELIASVDTHAPTYKPTQVLFKTTFDTMEPRTVTISVAGTKGHPTVAIDALVVRGKGRGVGRTKPPKDANLDPTSPPASAQPAPTTVATPSATASPAATPVASPAPSSVVSPTPTPTPIATPTPRPTATPSPTPAASCGSLQALIDAAPAGSVLTVPACTYRESVNVGKALTIRGYGSTINGKDSAGNVVRQTWMVVNASNVTVEGFKMRYAANAPQTGALRVKAGVSRFVLRDCDLGFAAGANVAYGNANDSVVEDCDIHDGGQLGVHIGGDGTNGRDNVLRNNTIRDNNTAGFDPEWEAGGLKATRQTGLRLVGNTVANNAGPGLWCDIYCRDIVVSGNRIHHNTHAGVFFEVSTGAKIADNRIWENGWGKTSWGWGAGILVSSSGGAEVYGNTVAWNYAGISVISQNRQDWNHSATNNHVHDNVVMVEYDRWAAFWAQDWSGPLFNAASNNRGANNRYWITRPEDSHWRFHWQSGHSSLASFNGTEGETNGTYLSDAQKTSILADAGMPTTP